MRHPDLCYRSGLSVRSVQLCQVACNAFLQLLHPRLELSVGEVLIAVVHRLELAAIDRHDGVGEEVQATTQDDKFFADLMNRLAVIFAKVGNGLEVRDQPTGEPNQFNIALRFPFQASARLNAVEVAINVDLEQCSGMVSRSTRYFGLHAVETQLLQIEFIDEDINDPDRIICRDVLVETFGE